MIKLSTKYFVQFYPDEINILILLKTEEIQY